VIKEAGMVVSPTTAVLLAVIAVCSCAEVASAKTARARIPATSHSVADHGQTKLRKKPPASHAPTQDEKAWMERASAPSNGAGGGGM